MHRPQIQTATDAHPDRLGGFVFLTVQEAAAFLRLSAVTLNRWRTEGQGPPYRKFGRRVLYGQSDLIGWAENQKRHSTSEDKALTQRREVKP
jgi:hypothetical protein